MANNNYCDVSDNFIPQELSCPQRKKNPLKLFRFPPSETQSGIKRGILGIINSICSLVMGRCHWMRDFLKFNWHWWSTADLLCHGQLLISGNPIRSDCHWAFINPNNLFKCIINVNQFLYIMMSKYGMLKRIRNRYFYSRKQCSALIRPFRAALIIDVYLYSMIWSF